MDVIQVMDTCSHLVMWGVARGHFLKPISNSNWSQSMFISHPVRSPLLMCPSSSCSCAIPCMVGRLSMSNPILSGPACIIARGKFVLSPIVCKVEPMNAVPGPQLDCWHCSDGAWLVAVSGYVSCCALVRTVGGTFGALTLTLSVSLAETITLE